jgi:S1-C subfamily serine protease
MNPHGGKQLPPSRNRASFMCPGERLFATHNFKCQYPIVSWTEAECGKSDCTEPLALVTEEVIRDELHQIRSNQMIRSLNLSVWLTVILAVLAMPGLLFAELKPEKIYQKVLPSVMTLEVENDAGQRFIGTGFLTIAEDIAVTAWHVVSDARQVRATFSDGEQASVVGFISKDAAHDIALIKLQSQTVRHHPAALWPAVPPVGSRAYVIGAPRGYDFSISDGLVSQIRRLDGFEQYQVSCPISPGNSGGPVLNESGDVIAVTSWVKTDAQNVSFAVPIREVLNLNARAAVTTWDKLIARPPGPSVAHPTPNSAENMAAAKSGRSVGGFSEFEQCLENAAGKNITVVVQEGAEQHTFTFTVPPTGLKQSHESP